MGNIVHTDPKPPLKSREVPFLFNPYFKIEFSKIILIVLRKAKKNIQNVTWYQILHPNLLVKSGRSGQYLAGTGSKKIDQNRNRNTLLLDPKYKFAGFRSRENFTLLKGLLIPEMVSVNT